MVGSASVLLIATGVGERVATMSGSLQIAVISILAVTGCAGTATPYDAEAMLAEQDTSLGVGDVFEVRVVGEEELSGIHRVSQDGTVLIPYIGQLEARGQEAPELAILIASRLREGGFLRNPQVTVFVSEETSKRVSVAGAVAEPGTFPVGAGLTIAEAVSMAGGFTSLASRNDVVVSRSVEGQAQRYVVPVGDIMTRGHPDFPLRAGDIVYVNERIF